MPHTDFLRQRHIHHHHRGTIPFNPPAIVAGMLISCNIGDVTKLDIDKSPVSSFTFLVWDMCITIGDEVCAPHVRVLHIIDTDNNR